ncbi:sporulation histidine kinase inhibitor Sda [Bacillus sp. JJ1474]
MSNRMLICTYRKACSLNLSYDFIKILETEIRNRDIDIQMKALDTIKST